MIWLGDPCHFDKTKKQAQHVMTTWIPAHMSALLLNSRWFVGKLLAVLWCMPGGVCTNPGRLVMYAWRMCKSWPPGDVCLEECAPTSRQHPDKIKMQSNLRARHESPRSVLPSRLRQRIRWREEKLKNGRQLTRWRAGQWCACSKLCVCLIQVVNLFVFIAAWSKLFLCLSS